MELLKINKKLEYSHMKMGYTEDERPEFWGVSAYVYSGIYIDPQDPQAFNSEEEYDEAKPLIVSDFLKREMGL